MKRPTPEQIEMMAMEIRNFLLKHEMWIDTTIYFNGKAFSTDDRNGHYAYNDPNTLYVLEDMNPRDYFEYVGEYLSMSFEGPFYEIINFYDRADYCNRLMDEFYNIIGKYGLYSELGNSWNLSLFPSGDWEDDEPAADIGCQLTAIVDAANELGWEVEIVENEAYFSQGSPAGEDFGFYVDVDGIVRNVSEYAANFDADEHAEMWIESRGKRGVPNSILTLIEDAEDIQKMLDDLALTLVAEALKFESGEL